LQEGRMINGINIRAIIIKDHIKPGILAIISACFIIFALPIDAINY
jgi:hypothetical protein